MAISGKPLPCRRVNFKDDILVRQLGLQLNNKLIDHMTDRCLVQRAKADDRIQPVTKLRRKHLIDYFGIVCSVILIDKPH